MSRVYYEKGQEGSEKGVKHCCLTIVRNGGRELFACRSCDGVLYIPECHNGFTATGKTAHFVIMIHHRRWEVPSHGKPEGPFGTLSSGLLSGRPRDNSI